MNSLNQKCKLCHQYLILGVYAGQSFICHYCNVEFGIYNGHLFSQSYNFEDPIIKALVMHLDTDFTIIVFTREASRRDVVVKGTWPQTKSQDALPLAKRLLNLLVYS